MNTRPIEERFEEKYITEPNSGCWLWIGAAGKDGYGKIKYKGKMQQAHRVSWELYNGPIPDGLCVLHKCDVRSCVNPRHLFLGTNKDNTQDCIKKGRFANRPGEKHPNSKLNDRQVETIKLLISSGLKQREIAERYGIVPQTVTDIKKGRRWKHLSREIN